MSFQAEAVVDLGTIAANVEALAGRTSAAVMPALKANGYGHGLVPAARACLDGGASRLGVATLDEAMELRNSGVAAPILAWLVAPGLDLAAAVDADIELAVASREQLSAVADAGARHPARIHLKADTGMGRGGAPRAEWQTLVDLAAKAQADGRIEIVGAFSHLACADEPGNPLTQSQDDNFRDFLDLLWAADVQPQWQHLANSAGLLAHPDTHYNLVRPGIAVYGYPPVATEAPLRPAMTLRARVVLVKTLPAGHGIGYGHTYVTKRPTRVAIVPLGYADGIPRSTSNRAEVLVGGRRCPIRGRVSMDQVVVEVDEGDVRAGDVVEFFGDGDITAEDWATWHDTISYEILTSIGPRIPRRYVGKNT
ncbi:alanine racemase [Stackebrandtia nassauensis]|uniref:Alanine racemase n=1 Tax=Stackebrandtia nassauensis (strain DSM 44728 / CIP 108903 / NRRL B-16338 / NBRC 102104 / LLR-40K-21) TaxID=446470 RepID=D3Q5X4_STANL|nr:alanine racemase [Stackebrandtia nassauensis]ADD40273.1 alanine racemase [Stackebrandtia nassauensis DSM 44728]